MSTPSSPRPYATLVSCDHDLDSLVGKLSSSANTGDARALEAAYGELAVLLLAHIDAEDGHILPLFEGAHPEQCSGLRSEHEQLRTLLSSLRDAVEHQNVQLTQIDELRARLRAHTKMEEAVLYPWMDHCLPLEVWNLIRNHFVSGAAAAP